MREFALLCLMAAAFAVGYLIMKRVDAFMENIGEAPPESADALTLCIALEHPEDIALVESTAEKISRNIYENQIRVCYGTAGEIRQSLEAGEIDLGILERGHTGQCSRRWNVRQVTLPRKTVACSEICIPLEPLSVQKAARTVIWKKNGGNAVMAAFLQSFMQESTQANAAK